MCGIAGILGSLAEERVESALRSLVSALAHRGPDDHGCQLLSVGNGNARGGRKLGLGNTRLAILDLSGAGHQPMQDSSTGNWIVFNGEVYNFKELRERLGVRSEQPSVVGHPPSVSNGDWYSQTDTEVVLRAYARWGRDCLRQLRGMFAFGLWDVRREELFLARDRLGIKPLYYYAGNGLFVFASEVRALLKSGLVPPKLDRLSLWQYLGYQSVPAPRTLIEGVRMLPPGHSLIVTGQGVAREACYWDLLGSVSPEARGATAHDARRQVGKLLREAVELHLVSDVSVGVFLSGGIDSSALVGLVRELGHDPKTFSVVFSEAKYSEASYSRKIADRFHTDHTEISLSERELLDQLPEAIAAMDHPTGDGINTYVVSSAVREAKIKVALSGLGGDELFAGYPSFGRLERAEGFHRFWSYAPAPVKTFAGGAVRAFGKSVGTEKMAALLEGDGTLANSYPLMRQLLSPAQRLALLESSVVEAVGASLDPYVSLLQQAFARHAQAGLISRISYAEARTYMHDVLLRDTDQMSMAHGLEVRVPFLDHKLVEYVMGLPDVCKRPDATPKRLLVESLGGLLPDDIVRRRKQGFALPFELWMRGTLREFCAARLGFDRLGGRGIFRPQALANFWKAFLSGRRDVSWSRLWVLVVLEEWLERNSVSA